MRSRDTPRQLRRFLLVGCSNFVVSFAVFYAFYRRWPLSPVFLTLLGSAGDSVARLLQERGIGSPDAALANVVGYSAGVVNSFLWNRGWTFGVRGQTASRFGRFVLLNLGCLLLSSLSLLLFTDLMGWPYKPVWLITMGGITAVNFALSKSWVFSSDGA